MNRTEYERILDIENSNISESDDFLRFKRNVKTDNFTTELFLFSEFNNGTSNTIAKKTTSNSTSADEVSLKSNSTIRKVFYLRQVLINEELSHYTEYTIEVQACQDQEVNKEPCSRTAITSIRTLPLGNGMLNYYYYYYYYYSILKVVLTTYFLAQYHTLSIIVQMSIPKLKISVSNGPNLCTLMASFSLIKLK